MIEADCALMSNTENSHRMLQNFLAHTIGKDASISDYRDSFYASSPTNGTYRGKSANSGERKQYPDGFRTSKLNIIPIISLN